VETPIVVVELDFCLIRALCNFSDLDDLCDLIRKIDVIEVGCQNRSQLLPEFGWFSSIGLRPERHNLL
jgi:hypothetical protein